MRGWTQGGSGVAEGDCNALRSAPANLSHPHWPVTIDIHPAALAELSRVAHPNGVLDVRVATLNSALWAAISSDATPAVPGPLPGNTPRVVRNALPNAR